MYDVVIVGGGVIGAAAAYELSKYKLSVLLIDKENDIACQTSKANSGIVHAGYDPKNGTLMARLNVEGARLIKELASKLSVPYRQTGSLVLGFNDDDDKTIAELYENGIKNGVEGLEILSNEQVKRLEPNVNEKVTTALYAATAAVVSPWELALALAETAVKNGVEYKFDTELTAITSKDGGYILSTSNGEIKCQCVVNAAGVFADKVAKMIGNNDFSIVPSKGEYYLLDKTAAGLVERVIFQCPGKNGKGVLVAPTAHGNIIVGPNSQPCDREDYSTDSEGMKTVRELAALSVPTISFRENIRNFAGVRANSDYDDFYIKEDKEKKHIFHLAGIKSPGLSSAPAIACYLVELMKNSGLELVKKESFVDSRKRIEFKQLDHEKRAELVADNPDYGKIICRCETVTEGEIKAALASVIPPRTIDGVKRRCGTGMGRCQGGFCSPKIHRILAEHYQLPMEEIVMDRNNSVILFSRTKQV